MTSRAFKVFLLMVLGFGSLWAYQFRTRDLRAWLERGEPPPGGPDDLAVLRSPVNRVLDPRKDSRALVTIYYQESSPSEPAAEETVLADLPTPVGPETNSAPRIDPEEEEPEAIILLEEPAPQEPPRTKDVRPPAPDAAKKEREKVRPREKPAEKAAEKPAEKKTDRPKAERVRPGRPDPHAIPADGSRPPGETGQGLAGDPARPDAAKAVPDAPRGETAPPPPRRKSISHVVREKETLASLARQYYQNDTDRWRDIFAANQSRLPDPDALSPGMVIEIPDARPPEGPGRNAKKPAAQPAKSRARPSAQTKNG